MAAAHGVHAAPLWERAGFAHDDADPSLRVPDDVHLRLWTDVMRALGDPTFPINYAAGMRIDDYDALELACKTAERVSVALDRILRYLRVWTNSVAFELHGSRIVLRRLGAPDVGYRAAMESSLAEVLHAVRSAALDDLAHSRPLTPVNRLAHSVNEGDVDARSAERCP